MEPTLHTLLSEEFDDSVGFILLPAAFQSVLRRSQVVRKITNAIRHGEITDQMLRSFVSELTGELVKGEALRGDIALAALAVSVETMQTPFAEEYLTTLAKLRVPEMSTSVRVARECLKRRASLPRNQVRVVLYSGGLTKTATKKVRAKRARRASIKGRKGFAELSIAQRALYAHRDTFEGRSEKWLKKSSKGPRIPTVTYPRNKFSHELVLNGRP